MSPEHSASTGDVVHSVAIVAATLFRTAGAGAAVGDLTLCASGLCRQASVGARVSAAIADVAGKIAFDRAHAHSQALRQH